MTTARAILDVMSALSGEPAPLSIGCASARLGVSVETLRYYEAEGLVSPARDAAGRRVYGVRDMDTLTVVVTMRRAGFGIADVRRLVDVKRPDPPDVLVARARAQLLAFRDEVRARRAALERSEDLLDRWLTDLDSTGL